MNPESDKNLINTTREKNELLYFQKTKLQTVKIRRYNYGSSKSAFNTRA